MAGTFDEIGAAIPFGRTFGLGDEFAGAKILSWSENLTRYERAREKGLDEVVLLNERGEPRRELFDQDGLHLNAAGYALWTAEVRRVLPR